MKVTSRDLGAALRPGLPAVTEYFSGDGGDNAALTGATPEDVKLIFQAISARFASDQAVRALPESESKG
jgi:hypothetical protein